MASQIEIVLDTETTGLSFEEDRIVEIGCIKLVERKPVQTFHTYLNPRRTSSLSAQKVHGLTDQFLQDKPLFSEVVHDFLGFVDGGTLVIHNASFDMGFLQAELNRLPQPMQLDAICGVVDTLQVARKLFPGQKNSLDALCNRFGIDISHRDLHGALKDADLLVKVYLQMTILQHKFSLEGQEKAQDLAKTYIWEYDGPIIESSPEEREAHEAFLASIKG